MVREFNVSGNVSIVNAHTPAKEIQISSSASGLKVIADLHQWTDTAVDLLKTELENRGMVVADGEQKELRLAITDAKVYMGFWLMRCILYLKVETGDGYVNEFKANKASGWA